MEIAWMNGLMDNDTGSAEYDARFGFWKKDVDVVCEDTLRVAES